jgi:hypothetical protein
MFNYCVYCANIAIARAGSTLLCSSKEERERKRESKEREELARMPPKQRRSKAEPQMDNSLLQMIFWLMREMFALVTQIMNMLRFVPSSHLGPVGLTGHMGPCGPSWANGPQHGPTWTLLAPWATWSRRDQLWIFANHLAAAAAAAAASAAAAATEGIWHKPLVGQLRIFLSAAAVRPTWVRHPWASASAATAAWAA